MVNYNQYNNSRTSTPEQILSNAMKTIGPAGLDWMDMSDARTPSLVRTVKNIPGVIALNNVQVYTNSADRIDRETGEITNTFHYGAFTGTASINAMGQGTLQSSVLAIMVPEDKTDPVQQLKVRESFAALCQEHKLPATQYAVVSKAHFFQDTRLENGLSRCIVVLEMSSVFGSDQEGISRYWTLVEHPAPEKSPEGSEAQASSPRRRSTKAKAAEEGALVTA